MTTLPPLRMSERTANHFATKLAEREGYRFNFYPNAHNSILRDGAVWPRLIPIDPKPQEGRIS